jgi:hypothetical protein
MPVAGRCGHVASAPALRAPNHDFAALLGSRALQQWFEIGQRNTTVLVTLFDTV